MKIKLSDNLIGWLEFAVTLGVSDAIKVLSLGLSEEDCITQLKVMCAKAEEELYASVHEVMSENSITKKEVV